jgi:hypothetical protein
MLVVVGGVGVQDGVLMAWPTDQDPVGAFAPHGCHPAFEQLTMPTQQCARGDEEGAPAGAGEQAQRAARSLLVSSSSRSSRESDPVRGGRRFIPRAAAASAGLARCAVMFAPASSSVTSLHPVHASTANPTSSRPAKLLRSRARTRAQEQSDAPTGVTAAGNSGLPSPHPGLGAG